MNILAMGGGENGRPGKPYEVELFDEEIVKMTGKKNPNLLFIAFTQKSAEGAENYYEIIKKNFTLNNSFEDNHCKDMMNNWNKKINNKLIHQNKHINEVVDSILYSGMRNNTNSIKKVIKHQEMNSLVITNAEIMLIRLFLQNKLEKRNHVFFINVDKCNYH